jgi:adenylate cyclase class 2
VARPEGLEPPAYWFEASCSIRLSYGRVETHRIIPTEMPASDSYIETEVKIRFPEGADAARAVIEREGFPRLDARTLESDQVFDRVDGELKLGGKVLRLRRSAARAMATFKGPALKDPALGERYKRREEIEFDVSNADAFQKMLDRLGYAPRFRYEKFRTKFAAPGETGVLSIDETPIGVFLELEGTPDWIDRTAARLGLSPAEYLTVSYATLYQEYRRSHPTAPEHMTFD